MGLLAGIETGGTKIVAALATAPDREVASVRIPTGDDPAAAIAALADFLAAAVVEHAEDAGPLQAIGIGSFGPCDPDPLSATFGFVTSTPKPGWADADVIGLLRTALQQRGVPPVPIGFDTDVNVAALGELHYGAGRGRALASLVYVTVGTGIGGGAVVDGAMVHGLLHPEMGHVRIPRPATEQAVFAGVCPYHGDCWEGVAAGPALAARWGQPGQTLPPDSPAWDLEADYIAAGLHGIVCTLSPQQIVLGGGVGEAPGLLAKVRPRLQQSLAGYLATPVITDAIDTYLVPPGCPGTSPGIVGALALAAAVRSDGSPSR